ncbi:MAG: Crp/Fnr family transcriptional regulator [Acidimicrobiales bacterium]
MSTQHAFNGRGTNREIGEYGMSSDKKEDRLKAMALFKEADDDAIDHLASAADEVTVQSGRVLIQQGSRHSELYVLTSGSAIVEVDGEKVADIPSGEMVGELSFFINKAASATVRTNSEANVLVIPYNRLDQILNDNPALVRHIAAELADRLYETDEALH